MPREICMLSEIAGRDTPCWWDCGTYCKRRVNAKRRTRGGGGLVTPADLENLAAWYRYGIGITSATGLVSAWADQSGNGRDLAQSTDTNKPALQSDNSILFDGVDNYMATANFGFGQPGTVYVLGRQITWTSGDRWFDGTGGTQSLLQNGSGSPALRATAGSALTIENALSLGTYGVPVVVFNGASSVVQVGGLSTTGDLGAGAMNGFALGATGTPTNFGNIQVKEVILFAAAHNSELRLDMINYLAYVGGLSI